MVSRVFAKRGLYESTLRALSSLGWKRKGERVLVGVSSGRDSVTLLHLLLAAGHRPVVAHLNHRLRDKESDRDERFLKDLCAQWNVEIVTGREDVAQRARQYGMGLEEAARIARYRFFAKVARRRKLQQVLVAHHQRDQAETVLLKIFQGCDREALKGMEVRRPLPLLNWTSTKPKTPASRIYLVRPFLEATLAEIELYARQNKLVWREDRSNDDLSHPRNWIRHRLLPLVERGLNRNVVKTIARLGR